MLLCIWKVEKFLKVINHEYLIRLIQCADLTIISYR